MTDHLHAVISNILTISITMLAFAGTYGSIRLTDWFIDRYL